MIDWWCDADWIFQINSPVSRMKPLNTAGSVEFHSPWLLLRAMSCRNLWQSVMLVLVVELFWRVWADLDWVIPSPWGVQPAIHCSQSQQKQFHGSLHWPQCHIWHRRERCWNRQTTAICFAIGTKCPENQFEVITKTKSESFETYQVFLPHGSLNCHCEELRSVMSPASKCFKRSSTYFLPKINFSSNLCFSVHR